MIRATWRLDRAVGVVTCSVLVTRGDGRRDAMYHHRVAISVTANA